MQRKKKLSEDFIKMLAEFTGGALSPEQFDKIINIFEKEIKLHYFTSSSESNLIRILESQFDKSFFLKECIQYPHHTEILITVCSNSNYLSDILVRNPEYFYTITNPDRISLKITGQHYKKLIDNTLSNYNSFDTKVNALRNFKRRELLKVGLADIFLKESLKSITYNLSQLAIAVSSALFDICYKKILIKHNIDKLNNSYCVVALGKLGGNELNFSSDIDLIVFTNKNTLLRKRIYYNQIITETIQMFIEQSSLISPKGFLYRIDFRLRPYGKNAALCGTLSEYLHYYEIRAEDWEKQMLIKTGYVGGSKLLYKKFISFTEQLVYPKSFTESPLVLIKKMKADIEKHNTSVDNIKTVPGGLRNIEFSVQALQMIHGGKFKTLRTGNTLKAIKELHSNELLNSEEYGVYSEAYTLFRKIEHYLQLMNNSQTHSIPGPGEISSKLAFYLGFNSYDDFLKKLNHHRKMVISIYNSITGKSNVIKWNVIEDINFSDSNRAQSNYNFLRNGKGVLGTKKFDNATVKLFESIQPELIKYLKSSIDPDKVIENFARFIRSSNLPNIWFREFNDKDFFELFLKICEYSQYAINLSAENKPLRDYLLSRKCILPADVPAMIDQETKFILYTLAVQFSTGMIKVSEVSYHLSEYINMVIKKLCDDFSKNTGQNNFAVIAMGSLGNREINFYSDVDLVFVTNNSVVSGKASKQFIHLLSAIQKRLSPLSVDCRLRPEGKSGQLLWNVNSYSQYIKTRARTWEVQAFLKARIIFGNEKILYKLTEDYLSVIKNYKQEFLKAEMLMMRNQLISSEMINSVCNLKKSPGSITDIEFVTAYHILSGKRIDKNLIGKEMSFMIKKLSLNKHFKLSSKDYIFLKSLDTAIQCAFDSGNHRIPEDVKKQKQISVITGYKGSLSLLTELKKVLSRNTNAFKNIFIK